MGYFDHILRIMVTWHGVIAVAETRNGKICMML